MTIRKIILNQKVQELLHTQLMSQDRTTSAYTIQQLRGYVAQARVLRDVPFSIRILRQVGTYCVASGYLDDAETCFREAYNLAYQIDDKYSILLLTHNLTNVHMNRGGANYEPLVVMYKQAISQLDSRPTEPELHVLWMNIIGNLSIVLAVLDRYDEALDRAEHFLELYENPGWRSTSRRAVIIATAINVRWVRVHCHIQQSQWVSARRELALFTEAATQAQRTPSEAMSFLLALRIALCDPTSTTTPEDHWNALQRFRRELEKADRSEYSAARYTYIKEAEQLIKLDEASASEWARKLLEQSEAILQKHDDTTALAEVALLSEALR